MIFTSIRNRLIFAISLFITILLISIVCGTYVYFRHVTQELIFKQEFSMITSIAKGLDDRLVTSHNALIAVSKVAPLDIVKNREITQKWLENRTGIRTIFNHGLFIFDATGTLVASSPQVAHLHGSSYSDLEFFQVSKSSSKPYISSPFRSKIDQNPVVVMTSPLLTEDGTMKGFLCGEINLLNKKGLLGDLSQVRLGSSGYLYVFGSDRTMIMHPDASRIMKKDVLPGANKLFDKALEGFEGSGKTVNSKGLHFLASFKRLQSTGWILAANYPLEEALQPMTSFRNYYLAGMIVVFLIGITVAWRLGIRITTPLTKLSSQVRALAHSNSNEYRRIENEGTGELGILSESFNSLLDAVRQREHALKESEQSYRNQFANNLTVMLLIDPTEGKIIDANAAALDFYRYDRERMLAMRITDINNLPASEVQQAMAPILRGEGKRFNFQHRLADGSLRDVEVSSSAIQFGGRTVLHSIIQDVTGRKQAEQEVALLADIGRLIGSTLNIDEVYERFAAETRKRILFDSLTVNLYNFQEKILFVAYVAGLDIDGRRQGDALVLEGSLSEAVIRARRSLRIQPSSVDEIVGQFPKLSPIFKAGLRSIMCVPLIYRDDVIGVLHFRSIKQNAYSEQDLLLAEKIGMQISGAIANAQQFNDISRTGEALEEERKRLQQALDEIRTLRGIVPICAYCKKIRDDEGYWDHVEKYVSAHTDAKFSHGICPSCFEREMKGIETSD